MQFLINSPEALLASLLSGKGPGRLFFITGPRGSGKTGWCQRLAEQAKVKGIQVRGLVSPAVFQGELKTGIDLLDLGSGERRRLAALRKGPSDRQAVIKWQMDEETLRWGNEILADPHPHTLFILDELGPLELEQGAGLKNGIELIKRRKYQIACVVVRPELLEIARALWPWGEVIRVDPNPPEEGPV